MEFFKDIFGFDYEQRSLAGNLFWSIITTFAIYCCIDFAIHLDRCYWVGVPFMAIAAIANISQTIKKIKQWHQNH
jgi:hypothetical protein